MKLAPAFVHFRSIAMLAALAASAGCGTTRWSDTNRTATEQLLVSDALERAISEVDFHALADQDVFLDTRYVAGAVDEKYLIATLRQHIIASGCVLQDHAEDARYIVEVRAGSVGTNRHELLFGIPSTHLPSGGPFPVSAPSIPEVPLVKRTAQQGVCKIGVYAYDRVTGKPVWQSGTRKVVSNVKDVWVFGTGPFQSGTVNSGTQLAGDDVTVPLADSAKAPPHLNKALVAQEIRFPELPDDPSRPPRRKWHPESKNATGGDANSTPAIASTTTTAPTMPSVSSSSDSSTPAAGAAGSLTPVSAASVVAASAAVPAPPNPAAGTIGLLQAVDWIHSVKDRGLTTKPPDPTTTSSSP